MHKSTLPCKKPQMGTEMAKAAVIAGAGENWH